jgi:hypothetical protein
MVENFIYAPQTIRINTYTELFSAAFSNTILRDGKMPKIFAKAYTIPAL